MTTLTVNDWVGKRNAHVRSLVPNMHLEAQIVRYTPNAPGFPEFTLYPNWVNVLVRLEGGEGFSQFVEFPLTTEEWTAVFALFINGGEGEELYIELLYEIANTALEECPFKDEIIP